MSLDFGGPDLDMGEERVGGGEWAADDSAVQIRKITQAYTSQSQHGSYAINLSTVDKEGTERDYQFYFSNRKGQTFYTKDGTKKALPGFALLNAICHLTCGKSAQEVLQSPKEKSIDLWDWESRKEIPTNVKTYPQITKKAIALGIIKEISNKYTKGKKTADKRERNYIDIAFNAKTKLTLTELAKGETEAKLFEKWEAKWLDQVDNQYVEVKTEEDVAEDNVSGDNPFGKDEPIEPDSTTADEDDDDDLF